jgi:hypothetical protein
MSSSLLIILFDAQDIFCATLKLSSDVYTFSRIPVVMVISLPKVALVPISTQSLLKKTTSLRLISSKLQPLSPRDHPRETLGGAEQSQNESWRFVHGRWTQASVHEKSDMLSLLQRVEDQVLSTVRWTYKES